MRTPLERVCRCAAGVLTLSVFVIFNTGGWTMYSPPGGSQRVSTSNVAGGGYAAQGQSAFFCFGPSLGTEDNWLLVTPVNGGFYWMWNGNLTPPPSTGHWTLSAVSPPPPYGTGMPIGQHVAWLEVSDGSTVGTLNHVVVP